MITVINILKVNSLLLTWKSQNNANSRYLVGIVKKLGDNDYSFEYAKDSTDFSEAKALGFVGYPAFKESSGIFKNDVLSTFRKRLPPRSRKDYKRFLLSHNLPENFDEDDFTLMAYTGVQLPSDGFDLIPDLSTAELPFDYITELAGTRYYLSYDEVCKLNDGDVARLEKEDGNEYDSKALAVYINEKKVGYVNRLHCEALRKLMNRSSLYLTVARKSGSVERPLIYLMLSVR